MRRLANIHTAFWDGGALWLIDALERGEAEPRSTDFHAHHAIQVVFNLGGRFEISGRSAAIPGDVVAVAPDVEHRFTSEGLTAILFIEPESRPGRAVAKHLFAGADIVAVPPLSFQDACQRMRAFWQDRRTGAEPLEHLGRSLIDSLAGDVTPDVVDDRVRRVMRWAAERIEGPVSLVDAAPEIGLSAARLRHLFVEQTGLPFKTYLLWLRLNKSVGRIVEGASLTEAAYDVGFADSAHFSRTFRRMFGVTPAALNLS